MKLIKKYVVGFMFNAPLYRVALIRKNKPQWQAGLLNGIGGKVESGENFLGAMVREFKEETGLTTGLLQWNRFCQMSGGENDDGGAFEIEFFACVGDIDSLVSNESEPIIIEDLRGADMLRKDTIENLVWLIMLAIDSLKDGRPMATIVKYP